MKNRPPLFIIIEALKYPLLVRIILTKGRHKVCFKIFPAIHQTMVTVPVEEVQIWKNG